MSGEPPPFPPAATSAPTKLVVDRRLQFGTFDGPVLDPQISTVWTGLAQRAHDLRIKEWQAFQLGTETHFVLGAVYDAKMLGLIQMVVVEIATGRVSRHQKIVSTRSVDVATGLDSSTSVGEIGGLRLEITNEVFSGRLKVQGHDRRPDTTEDLSIEVVADCSPDIAGHLVICHPFGDKTALYSDKCVMAPTGRITLGEVSFEVDPETSFLIMDDHKGHYPSPMQYDWVTGASKLRGQPRIAFNLTSNQVRDPQTYNENAVFVGNRVHRLRPVHFERPDGVHAPWHIVDEAGDVEITFTPKVRNEQHVGPRSSLVDYYGPFGTFEGRIGLEDGSVIQVEEMYGMGEQKLIRV